MLSTILIMPIMPLNWCAAAAVMIFALFGRI